MSLLVTAERLSLRAIGRLPAPLCVALARQLQPARGVARSGASPRTESGLATLDPATRLLLAIGERRYPPLHTLSVPRARRQAAHLCLQVGPNPRPEVRARQSEAGGEAGPIPVRLFTPEPGDYARPLCVFFHGGGGVVGDIDSHDPLCRELACAMDAVVVSVGYRLAPEHKFPAGLDDAASAYQWAASNAAALGGDPARLVVCGNSAGANFATSVCRKARDGGWPLPALQLLISPITDLAPSFPSRELFAEGFFLTDALIEWFLDHYLADRAQVTDSWASPLRAQDLRGLPPAIVVTAGFDPLRDEARAYADRLAEAGVVTQYLCKRELIHGFEMMTGAAPAARRALEHVAAVAKTALS